MTHEMAKWILENNGDCPDVSCEECLKGVCQDRYDSMRLAHQWLADHPETPAKPVDPRRYEIAKGIYHVFIKDEDNGIYNDPSESASYALMYADALIAELDKEAEK